MDKIKLGIWGDSVTPTGFARVLHSIVKFLPKKDYDIFWIGVNYFGDPHPYEGLRIYPASLRGSGDFYGFNRAKEIFNMERPDIIFILNDAWITTQCLSIIKEMYKPEDRPKIVTYVPVDAVDHNPEWYKNFDIVDKVVAYTEFGKEVINIAVPSLVVDVIPHGIDRAAFRKLEQPKKEIKKMLYPDRPDYYEDSFIVLNANRNQPRKRIDITMQSFALFAKDKPENVKLYLHMGLEDMHMSIIPLAVRYGIDKRLIITNYNKGVQTVPDEALNRIYNGTDVGINTGLGEGWGLPNMEHASIGAPQVVGAYSALKELYQDCGLLVPASGVHVIDKIMTTGYLVNPVDVSEKLNELYNNKELYETLSLKSIEKFSQSKYSWENISKIWDKVFKELRK